MRITLLADSYLPHAGGSRFFYHNLFRRLAGLGHQVTVLTGRVEGWKEFDGREQTPNLRIERRFDPLPGHSYRDLPRVVRPMLQSIAAVLRRRPDVLHCGDLYPSGITGVLLKRLLRIPLVAYCHGEDITLTDQRRFQPRLRNLIYRTADMVVANGEFAVENLRRIGIPESKVVKITPGLDPTTFFPAEPDPSLRERYGLPADELVVVTVARLASRKGHLRVLQALAALRGETPTVRYLIAGRGPMEAELRAAAADLGLAGRVVFAGYVPDDRLNAHYALADVAAMPNTAEAGDVEGFGMVFLEANAAGKPVIGGRSGGTAEAVADGETGFLVANDEELRTALLSLLNDPALRARMGLAGLRRARESFDWESRARRLEAVSYRVLGREVPVVPRPEARTAQG